MEYNGQFRGGRGERGFGYEGKKGKGSRGRGRGRGQGGGRRCRDRGNFNLLQQRHEEQGYTEGYVNSQHRYSPPPQQQHHYSNGNSYLMHGTTLESSRYLEHQYQLRHQKKLKQYQPFEIAQDQYQQPQFQQQDYTSDGRKGDTNGNSSLFHPPIDKYEFQPQPVCLQQYQQPPPPQYQQPPPPPLHQKYQNESSTYLANLPKPPMPITAQPAADYAEAAPPNENVSKTQHMSYRERSQPPPLLYQQLQQQPPLPLVPQHLRGDWNYLPQQSQQWQQRSHQQQQFDREHAHQGLHPKDQRQTQRNQHPRFQERRQNNKQQRTPPPSYICHNCNQSGHWKQYCPLFDKQKNSFQQRCYSEIGPDQQLCFDAGSDSHDPRRSCGPHNEFSPRFEAKNELRRQPPLPNGPAPPLPSNPQLSSIGSCAQPLPPQSSQQLVSALLPHITKHRMDSTQVKD
ncbi:unnamed protein product [Peronospora belbahrii]|uniref:CCHC-type domain-containing protein n=1 Tax=Peronospora belbahrii TaxID=622444 RepID=A0AAU9KU11_9STRA|nr:unnamed protein product [Peronospora belbahrii]